DLLPEAGHGPGVLDGDLGVALVAHAVAEVEDDPVEARVHHRFEEIIAYVSRDETILPGDFIAAGTVGNGCGLEQNRWLVPGDVVELEIECLGVLRNQVVQT
ncbi:MAG: fumarylacetoacetate hydrolase family protein, partial [Planctomycetes bacterium]|nr:fumarylacetoacetate hydrolase family protein [Planctomycetota bacterium]